MSCASIEWLALVSGTPDKSTPGQKQFVGPAPHWKHIWRCGSKFLWFWENGVWDEMSGCRRGGWLDADNKRLHNHTRIAHIQGKRLRKTEAAIWMGTLTAEALEIGVRQATINSRHRRSYLFRSVWYPSETMQSMKERRRQCNSNSEWTGPHLVS